MNPPLHENVTSIINNQPLAFSIHKSIISALKWLFLCLPNCNNAWYVYNQDECGGFCKNKKMHINKMKYEKYVDFLIGFYYLFKSKSNINY